MDIEPFDWSPERKLVADLLDKLGIPVIPLLTYFEGVRERRLRRVRLPFCKRAPRSPELMWTRCSPRTRGTRLPSFSHACARSRGRVSRPSAHTRARPRLANAIDGDDAVVDHAHQVIRALAELEPIDIVGLQALEATGPIANGAELERPFNILGAEFRSDVLVARPGARPHADMALRRITVNLCKTRTSRSLARDKQGSSGAQPGIRRDAGDRNEQYGTRAPGTSNEVGPTVASLLERFVLIPAADVWEEAGRQIANRGMYGWDSVVVVAGEERIAVDAE